jgi:hypothetical protein
MRRVAQCLLLPPLTLALLMFAGCIGTVRALAKLARKYD